MSDSKDKRAKAPPERSPESAERKVDFGPVMSLEEAEALREGDTIPMEEFKARFGLQ